MSYQSDTFERATPFGAAASLNADAVRRAIAVTNRRRVTALSAVVIVWFWLMAWLTALLASDGFAVVDTVLVASAAVATPWVVVGFVNALIGFSLRHIAGDGLARVAPFAASGASAEPLTLKTAVLLTIRNEDPQRTLKRFQAIKADLDTHADGQMFDYFVLSDTSDPAIAGVEEDTVAAWQRAASDPARIVYRRRRVNVGFKAGNIQDFCRISGGNFDLMLPLDADSFMTAETIVRMCRIMEAHTGIGILQSLVTGLPSRSPFARLFQFGMRHGMRSYTMGQAWWSADCGPFWGHNALVRVKPFMDHCQLPVLAGKPPLGGTILSHDQVEAVLMRRAGFDVRVMPEEMGSFEENPPNVIEFLRRETRWCQGNMQYLKLLALPGLHPASRAQLTSAILMFAGAPAATLFIALLPLVAWTSPTASVGFAADAAALYVTFLVMSVSPKLAGLADALLTPGEVARFGGIWRFAASAVLELIFAFLYGAVSTFRTTVFMIGLAFGRSGGWHAPQRDPGPLSGPEAARRFWPQTLFGSVVLIAMASASPSLAMWSLPLTAGYVLAIPFAVITANAALGAAMQRAGLAAVPEDFNAPPQLEALRTAPGI